MRLYKHVIIINKVRTFYFENSCVVRRVILLVQWLKKLTHQRSGDLCGVLASKRLSGFYKGFQGQVSWGFCVGSWKDFVLIKSGFVVFGA